MDNGEIPRGASVAQSKKPFQWVMRVNHVLLRKLMAPGPAKGYGFVQGKPNPVTPCRPGDVCRHA